MQGDDTTLNNFINKIKIYKYKKNGLIVGKNFKCEKGVILEPSLPWLVEIGDNVTLAPYVHILAHDASTKIILGATKIGRVKIGDNVFVGAKSIILPNVKIGNNVIVGAGSVVTKSIPDNKVYAGVPAKEIMNIDEYLKKYKLKFSKNNFFEKKIKFGKKIFSKEQKKQIKTKLIENQDVLFIP